MDDLVITEQAPLVVVAIMTTWVAIAFTAVVSLRHNDAANRLWAVGFCVFATGTWAVALHPAHGRAAESAIAALALPFLPLSLAWGAALLRERAAWPEIAGGGVTVALAVWVGLASGGDGEQAAWTAVIAVCAALCVLAGVRFLDGPLRYNLNARILVVIGAVSGFSSFVEFAEAGTDPDLPYDVTTVALAVLMVVAAPCLTALRVEQSANWWATRDETARRDLLGLLSADAFQQDAEDRLRRCERSGTRTSLTRIQVDGLAEINTAFGRDAGDAALAFAARVLSTYTPPSALIGHLGAGDFVIHSLEDGALIDSAVRTGLLRDPLPPLLPTRFGVTTAVAAAEPGSTLADLLARTTAAVTATSPHTEEPHRDMTPTPEDRTPSRTDADTL